MIAAGGTSIPAHAGRSHDYVKAYENVLHGIVHDVTPEDVVATADGGDLVVATSGSPHGVLVNWLVKLDAGGRPQWTKELGCLDLPPGEPFLSGLQG